MRKLVEFATIAGLLVAVLAWFQVNPDVLLGYRVDVPVTAFVIGFAIVWVVGRSLTDLRRFWRWYRGTWKSTRFRALHDVLEEELADTDYEVAYSLGPATIDMEPWDRAYHERRPFAQPERTTRRSQILYELEEIELRFPKEHRLQDWLDYLGELTEHSLRSDYKAARGLTESWRRKIGERPHPYPAHPGYD